MATTAIVKSYSLALSFDYTAANTAGDTITFLDPLTSANIALTSDGNGNWKATISCPHKTSEHYEDEPIRPGMSLGLALIDDVLYSLAFSNEAGKEISEAIRATIIGIPESE